MATPDCMRICTIEELRRDGALPVAAFGQSLIVMYNGARPCAAERSLAAQQQAISSWPSTSLYNSPLPAPAFLPIFYVEIRDNEIWLVKLNQSSEMLSKVRKALSNGLKKMWSKLAGRARKVRARRAPSVRSIAVDRRSTRRMSLELFEAE